MKTTTLKSTSRTTASTMRAFSAVTTGAKALFTAISVGLLLTRAAVAADGDLDPTFGIGGKIATDFLGGFDGASAVAVQSDGKIVAAGFADDSNFQSSLALVRYDANGNPDPTFGAGGKVLIDFFNQSLRVDLAIQSDGKIVIVGTVGGIGMQWDFGIARCDANGNPDLTFGVGGKVTTDFFGNSDEATSVAIQSDGKIVVGGVARDANFYSDFALARYDANGNPDPGFGVGGKVVTDFLGSEDRANDVAIQKDGRIVAVGAVADAAFNRYFGVARYNSDGTLDANFSGGKVTTQFFEYTEANAVVIQPADGKIIAAGYTFINVVGLPLSYFDFALARYNPDGTPDAGFGTGGKVTTDFGGFEIAYGVALQADGKIVAVGSRGDLSNVELNVDFAIARYDTSGSLDATFGNGGQVVTDFQYVDVAGGVAIQSDCKIVVAGYSWQVETGNSDFALARYNSSGCAISGPCPWSQGHWKNNANLWPVNTLTLGSQSYTKSELLAFLNASTQTDASLILARQLIAAKLNVANGSDATPVASVITHADSLLASFAGKLPYKVKSSSTIGQMMTSDAAVLNNYNNALLTPGCAP